MSVMLGILPVGALANEAPSFERYQVIIDRSPFGGLPGTPTPGVQPNFADNLVFVGVFQDENRVLAVIQPKGAPRAEYKAEGETVGDVTVVKIEVAGESSKLYVQRGLEKATLTYPPRGAPGSLGAAPATVVSVPLQPGASTATGRPAMPTIPRRRPFVRGE